MHNNSIITDNLNKYLDNKNTVNVPIMYNDIIKNCLVPITYIKDCFNFNK